MGKKIIRYALYSIALVVTIILTFPVFVVLSPYFYCIGEIPNNFLAIRDYIPKKTRRITDKILGECNA